MGPGLDADAAPARAARDGAPRRVALAHGAATDAAGRRDPGRAEERHQLAAQLPRAAPGRDRAAAQGSALLRPELSRAARPGTGRISVAPASRGSTSTAVPITCSTRRCPHACTRCCRTQGSSCCCVIPCAAPTRTTGTSATRVGNRSPSRTRSPRSPDASRPPTRSSRAARSRRSRGAPALQLPGPRPLRRAARALVCALPARAVPGPAVRGPRRAIRSACSTHACVSRPVAGGSGAARGAQHPPLSADGGGHGARLRQYFEPHNARLETMLGRALGW